MILVFTFVNTFFMYTEQELLSKIKELEIELHRIKKQKRYGLVWEDKSEDVVERCKNELPILTEDYSKRVIDWWDDLTHILIEWDNYHALSVLAYTHEKKVDAIYIDPPYNTGNKDFIYNDSFVDKEDGYRHSKWLSFISRRLELAHKLLKQSGVIFISIDDNEHTQLKLLCDSIFWEKQFITNLIVQLNPRWRTLDKHFAKTHEYILVYTKWYDDANIVQIEKNEDMLSDYKFEDEKGKYRLLELRNRNPVFNRSNRPNLFYPFYISTEWKVALEPMDWFTETFPRNSNNEDWCWTWSKTKAKESLVDLVGKRVNTWAWRVYRKDRMISSDGNIATTKEKSIWLDGAINNENGKEVLRKILWSSPFDYPKSVELLKRCFRLSWSKDAVILDFFAWSGTTWHAVLELNKEDGWKRQFILCTNNENSIAEEVTYPRIRNVINGYADVEGIPANLRYYRTDFIWVDKSIDDLRGKFMGRCTDMLQVRENTFPQFPLSKNGSNGGWEWESEYFRVFQNTEKLLVVMYHPYEIESFKKWFEFLREKESIIENSNVEVHKEIVVYIFSMGWEIFEEELAHLSDRIRIETIPDEVLETYKKIFGF